MIELVTLAEERLRAEPQGGVHAGATAGARCRARRRSRRSCAAPCSLKDDKIEGAWRRLILDFRGSRCDPRFRQRRGACALQPGRRGDARPHHPHQELAARRCRARERQARRVQARRAKRGRSLRRALQGLFRAQQRARRRHQDDARSAAARRAGARRRPVRPRPQRRRTPASPPIIAEAAVASHHRCRGDRPLRVDLRSRHVRHANTGRSNRPSSAAPEELPLAGQVAVITGAAGAIGAATAQGLCGGRRRGGAARSRRDARRRRRRKRSAARRSRCAAT